MWLRLHMTFSVNLWFRYMNIRLLINNLWLISNNNWLLSNDLGLMIVLSWVFVFNNGSRFMM